MPIIKSKKKLIKSNSSSSCETCKGDNYVPNINTNSVLGNDYEKRVPIKLVDYEYLKRYNYLSEFETEGEKDEARKNLNIPSNKEIYNPENQPYLNGDSVTNVKEALDNLYEGAGKKPNPEEIPYKHSEYPEITNIKNALDSILNNLTDIELEASNVKYTCDGKLFLNVKEALDFLLYTELKISSFYASPSEAEIGDTIKEVTFKWSCNKPVVSQTIDGNPIEIGTTYIKESNISNTISRTLQVSDGKETKSSTASLTFKDGKYFGASIDKPTNEDIMSKFSMNLNMNRGSEITIDARKSEYIYIMVPQNMKDIRFSVGGFEGGFQIVDNHYQFSKYGKQFDNVLFKSDQPSLGLTRIKIL